MSLQQDCLDLIKKKLAKEISSDEFYCEVMLLEKKYPGIGFKEAAEQYANKIRENERIKPKSLPKKVNGKMAAAGDYEEEVPF